MTHNVNPGFVSPSAIARTAEYVADAVREESKAIASLQNGTRIACAASKEVCSR
jgi:hypothetical protein